MMDSYELKAPDQQAEAYEYILTVYFPAGGRQAFAVDRMELRADESVVGYDAHGHVVVHIGRGFMWTLTPRERYEVVGDADQHERAFEHVQRDMIYKKRLADLQQRMDS